MKILLKLSSFFLMALMLFSCEKKVSEILYEGGTAPVVSANKTGTLTLANATKNEEAVTLKWTNPNYQFTTGLSSQDVNYLIEIDTAGGNFSSGAKKVLSVKNSLSMYFSQNDLDFILTQDMSLVIGRTYVIEVRVTSSLGTNSVVALKSNVLRFTVVPYQDPTLLPPDLYITGDATVAGWTNAPPASQKFAFMGAKKYELVQAFVPGKQYKFLTKHGQWQPQYGSASATGGDLQVNDGSASDPPAIPTPAVAGNYKITVTLANPASFTIVKL